MKYDSYIVEFGSNSTITVSCNGKPVWKMPSSIENLKLLTDFERWLEESNPDARIRKIREVC